MNNLIGYKSEFDLNAVDYGGDTTYKFGSAIVEGKLVAFWFQVKDSKAVVRYLKTTRPSILTTNKWLLNSRFRWWRRSFMNELKTIENLRRNLDKEMGGTEAC